MVVMADAGLRWVVTLLMTWLTSEVELIACLGKPRGSVIIVG